MKHAVPENLLPPMASLPQRGAKNRGRSHTIGLGRRAREARDVHSLLKVLLNNTKVPKP